jgi:hypothetical protein
MPNHDDYIDWNQGREPVHTLPPPKASGQRYFLRIRTEEYFGSLLSAAGIIWATYVATQDYASLWHMQIMPPGPVEVCGLGILVWLHAKWRRSMKAG